MRIVIEIDGTQIASIVTEPIGRSAPAAMAMVGDVPPGPAPRELLERAKKLGAISAGPAQLGIGAALHASAASVEAPDEQPATRKSRPRRKVQKRRK
jgi:hypothetical protein